MRKIIVMVVLLGASLLGTTAIAVSSAGAATQVTVDGVSFTTYATASANGTTYYAIPSSAVNQALVAAGAATGPLAGQNPGWWWVPASASTPSATEQSVDEQVTVDGVTFTTYAEATSNGTPYYATPSSAVAQQLQAAGAHVGPLSGQNSGWSWVASTSPNAPASTTSTGSAASSSVSPAGTGSSNTVASSGMPSGYSHAIFSDQFSNLNNWNNFITDEAAGGWPWNANGQGGSGLTSGAYNAEYFSPSHAFITSQGLDLQATPGSSESGDWWTSGAVSSYNHFAFDGGYVQIVAKMPDSTAGAWPSLWLLAGPGASSSREIDMFEGGMTGTGAVNSTYAFHVQPDGSQVNTGTDLSSGFNTYGMAWVPGQSVTYYLNGREVGQITNSEISIPNEPMELVMSLDMATSETGGWHSVSGNSGTFDMLIRSVNVYQ